MRILYAGDSEAGGPANYLLGILKFLRAEVTHLAPSKTLHPKILSRRYDAIILSDFSKKKTPAASERAIREQARKGTGLLMVGGWGSFSGPFGGWHGSMIEEILPVNCLARNDQLNFPGGALIRSRQKHPIVRSLSFKNPPVICGLNQIRPKKNALVILTAERLVDGVEFPLFVVPRDPEQRVAALATDLAPHWCGGLVDWGRKRMGLSVRQGIRIEVGELYVRFVSGILKWLAGK